MKKTKQLFTLLLVAIFYSCGVTTTVKSNGTTIPPGTEVPFGKISNEAFAENYIDADVIVDCAFLSSQTTANYTVTKPPKNHFTFQVVGDDVEPTENELSGALEGVVVFAPMEYSDLIFSLKKGDKITIRGGTLVTKMGLGGTISGLKTRYVHLKANSIKLRE